VDFLGDCWRAIARAPRLLYLLLTAPRRGAWVFRRIRAPLSARRLRRKFGGRIPRLYRLPWYAYLGACTLVVAVEAVLTLDLGASIAVRPTGARAFFHYCHQCHGLNRPFNFNHTTAVWNNTLDRMYRHVSSEKAKSLPLDKRDAILDLLTAIRGYSDRRLVHSKCYVCHFPIGLFSPARTAEEWGFLLDRIQRRNPYHITERQRDQIYAYLTAKPALIAARPSSTWDPAQKSLFERKCGMCHTLDIVFLPQGAEADWPDILARMGRKQPDFLTADEALSVRPLVDAATADEKRFFRVFPHSRMRERTP
jgi:mono/diheme cytochrome c family protein